MRMRNLVDIMDLSAEEIDRLIDTASDIAANPEKYQDCLKHKKMATLFFEPSTRTRLSFESAMLSLGGNVIGFSDANTCSASKGESLADTITVVSGYVDIIAMRHPKEGAPYIACKHSSVPVINAGDGGHYHPTQTLADLMTIRQRCGRLDHLTVGFCGDLRYGRTVHSLIDAMARYPGTRFVLISPRELALPAFVLDGTIKQKGIPCKESLTLEGVIGELDILYMTRVQKERFADTEVYERLKDVYVLNPEKMALAPENMIVMHPLPRINEIAPEVDDDPRACYFTQTKNGRLMRMALILKLLGERELPDTERAKGEDVHLDAPCMCGNIHCISGSERGLPARFYRDRAGAVRCAYCDAELPIPRTSNG